MDISQPRMSIHARQRATEMAVSEADIYATVVDADTDYSAGARYPGCRVATRGRLAVPYDPLTGTVITVLWNTAPDGGSDIDRTTPAPARADATPTTDVTGARTTTALAPRPVEQAPARELVAATARRAARAAVRELDDDRPMCLDCCGYHDTIVDALACDRDRYGT